MTKNTHHRTNSSIRCPQVRVIAGEANEILPTEKAIQIARSKGLDLIEVAPNANPPVCKIADYGKFLYELEKSKPKVTEAGKVKEIGLHANVAEHDLQTKIRHAQGFLERKLLVLFRLKFRGRENAHRDLGESLLQKVIHHLQDIGHPDPVKIAGNNMLLRISPKS